MRLHKLTRRTILLGTVITLLLSGCSAPAKNLDKKPSEQAAALEEKNEKISLTNGDMIFTIDCKSTHFTVSDKSKNIKLSSTPNFECSSDSDETQKRFLSELVLTYYDSNSQKYEMYSFADSAEKGNAKVFSGEDVVRVVYEFGNVSSELLVPDVMTEEWYETINNKLSSSQRRRIKLYYTLYSSDDPPKDYKEMAKKYPALENNNLYLINQNLSDLNRMDINDYIIAAGYTKDDYDEMIKKFNIQAANSDTPGFTVPVEYKLQKDGFSASVLFDQIKEKSENYTLTDVELLPYFAATSNKQNGKFIVPDGCGAIIDMNTKAQGSYVSSFYGNDAALSGEENEMLVKNQYLPVFAVSSDKYSSLAVVEGASEISELKVETFNSSNPANNASITFHYRARYSASNKGMSSISGEGSGTYNLYRDYSVSQTPSVRYFLYSSGMSVKKLASKYRDYLSEKGKMPKCNADGGVLLDFYCVSSQKKSILGISYTERTVLTTFKQIKDVVEQLKKSGVSSISVRLCAYRSKGLNYTAYNDFDFYKKIGTKKELSELCSVVNENGGNIYFDADFQTVYSDSTFDGYSARGDSAYTPEEKLARTGEYNVVTRKTLPEKIGYIISPAKYNSISESFLRKFEKSDLPGGVGIAYIKAGKLLTGSYQSAALDRIESALKITEVLSKNKKPLLIGGGNVFAAGYANEITDIDMFSSCYDVETEAIPFWQMIYHGNVDYSSSPINTSDHWQNAFLKSVEYGCGLHYALIGMTDDDSISLGVGQRPYSMGVNERIARIAEECKSTAEYYGTVAGREISSHKRLADGVYQTKYSDGSIVIVNYSEKQYKGKDEKVDSMSFIFKKGAMKE